MAARDLFGRMGESRSRSTALSRELNTGIEDSGQDAHDLAPLGGTRAEAVQRLQVGLTGICLMILLVGLASIIGGQAERAEQSAVPDAAPTTEPTAAPPQRDPLADAGVVPDIPAETEVATPQPTPKPTDGAAPVTVPDTPPTQLQQPPDAP